MALGELTSGERASICNESSIMRLLRNLRVMLAIIRDLNDELSKSLGVFDSFPDIAVKSACR